MMGLIWRQSALEDLAGIIDYIGDRNPEAARALQDAIEACAERLLYHPFMYRRGRVEGTREAVVHPNYLLVVPRHERCDRSCQLAAYEAALSMIFMPAEELRRGPHPRGERT